MAKRTAKRRGASRAYSIPKEVTRRYAQYRPQPVPGKYRVVGRTVGELLAIDVRDFNRLDESDLRKAVTQLASAANKRYRRFQASGKDTPATRMLEQSGGALSAKGKDLNQLRAEFARAKQFLEAKTSTARGWAKVQEQTLQSLAKRGISVTKKDLDTFWRAYEDLKDISPEVANRSLKYDVMRTIAERIGTGQRDPEEIAEQMRREISRIYEEREASYARGGVSEFFEL